MTEHAQPPVQVVDGEEIAWTAHPRFADIRMKQMLTSAANPLASVSRVRVPPGGVIGWHQHAMQTETVYVLAGDSTLTLGESPVRFGAGQIVAIPPAIRHTLVNDGAETVELLCFFTPPSV
jgi:quercetin dioxygenase-like cupin family protein